MFTYKRILNKVLEDKRSSRTSPYSLRLFAKNIGVSASHLSEVLNGHAHFSVSLSQKVCEKLSLSEDDQIRFLSSVEDALYFSKITKANDHFSKSIYTHVENTQISWHYFAILSIIELDDFDGTFTSISSRLGLDLKIVHDAIDKLAQVNMLTLKDQKVSANVSNLITTNDIESNFLKVAHKETLNQAIERIDSSSVENRDFTSMTMAIDKNKIPFAKEKIKEFRRTLATFLEEGEKNEVYNLNIQLYPLTEINDA